MSAEGQSIAGFSDTGPGAATTRVRNLSRVFLIVGGLSWIAFSISHLFFPRLLGWKTALESVPAADVLGFSVSNRGFIQLLNADLFLYDALFGILSLLLASKARAGKRIAAQFSIGMGVYFVVRTGLQLYYFGMPIASVLQAAASLAFAGIYLFPVFRLRDFAGE